MLGKKKRKNVDRDLVPFFLNTRTHAFSLSVSLTRAYSIFRFFFHTSSFFRSLSLSLLYAFVLVLTLSYNMQKMQRITIFFLSPFVHNVESTFRGSFSIFTRGPCKITTFSLTVAPIHILFYFFLLMMSRTRSVFSRGTLIPYIVL